MPGTDEQEKILEGCFQIKVKLDKLYKENSKNFRGYSPRALLNGCFREGTVYKQFQEQCRTLAEERKKLPTELRGELDKHLAWVPYQISTEPQVQQSRSIVDVINSMDSPAGGASGYSQEGIEMQAPQELSKGPGQ